MARLRFHTVCAMCSRSDFIIYFDTVCIAFHIRYPLGKFLGTESLINFI